LAALAGVVWPDIAAAQPLRVALPSPGEAAWQPLLFRSIERATEYSVELDPSGRPAFRAQSRCGASAMRLALGEDLELGRTPRLAWRWRMERGIEVDREQTREGDDFAARVYVLFEFDPEAAGAFARFERAVGRRLFGVDLPGKTINYVWASKVKVGEVWTSPHHDDAQLVSVATDSAGASGADWQEVIVDLASDARNLHSPGSNRRPYALALMVDADDTCQEAIAWFSDFRLLGPPEVEGRNDEGSRDPLAERPRP
jgi:hypothetical protein